MAVGKSVAGRTFVAEMMKSRAVLALLALLAALLTNAQEQPPKSCENTRSVLEDYLVSGPDAPSTSDVFREPQAVGKSLGPEGKFGILCGPLPWGHYTGSWYTDIPGCMSFAGHSVLHVRLLVCRAGVCMLQAPAAAISFNCYLAS